jgi:soluble P-type ATPase
MTITIPVPGRADLALHTLLLDVNGTLTRGGVLLDGVAPRLDSLRGVLEIRLLSADTFGNVADVAQRLGGLAVTHVSSGAEKAAVADNLGAENCAAAGNGVNDQEMLRTVALGIAVIGPEGAAPATVAAADIVTGSVLDALDLLTEPTAVAATLRA